jgi:hypothetical protein
MEVQVKSYPFGVVVLGLSIGNLALAADLRPNLAQPVQSLSQQERQGGTTSDPGSKSHIIKGEVLKIEGSAYVIKQANGKEIRLGIDQDTRMETTPKPGDKITAQMAEDGRTRSIRKASSAESPSSVQSPDSP